ncbi:uncharacterized protein LOC142163195 [Nicotiana tabacum]|uniref:Uncharacterized protein LOC142163195 n=1 Tax=Nicotiana tabacum TaxID=4097 RepID=A0AC58RV41_TOBAC
MCIALQAKRKLEFVIGTCRKDRFRTELHEDWETCNAIVLSWIMNTVLPDLLSGIVYASSAHLGTDSVSTYFTKLKELWAEYDALIPSPGCDCPKSRDYIEHLQQQRLLQFLISLNESYKHAHIQILMKTIEPIFNQAYAMIIEDESQRSQHFPPLTGKIDPMAVHENCYKLIGYPADFKAKKKFVVNNAVGNNVADKKSQVVKSEVAGKSSKGGYFFTEEQYNHILGMLNRNKNAIAPQVNLAGIAPYFMADLGTTEWIVDSGASHHITASLNTLINTSLTGKVRGIDKEQGGLYIVRKKNNQNSVKNLMTSAIVQGKTIYNSLWHQRLGHASIKTMKHMSFLWDKVLDVATNKDYSICPLAKRSKLMFPTSHTVSEKPLELIYIDLKFQTRNWREYVEGVIYLINRLPTDVLQGKSPYELLHGRPPSLDHLRVFGCLCYATTSVRNDKFDARARATVFLGYSTTQKGYKLLDLSNNKFFMSRDVVFKEHIFPFAKPTEAHLFVSDFYADAATYAVDDVHSIDADATIDVVYANSPAHADTVPNQADIDSVEHEHLDNVESEELAEILDSVPSTDNSRDEVPDGNLFEEVYMELPQGFRRHGETKKFKVKDLGELEFFLRIEMLRSHKVILLNQRKYALQLILDLELGGAKPVSTPLDTNQKFTSIEHDKHLGVSGDEPLEDVTAYQRLIGGYCT